MLSCHGINRTLNFYFRFAVLFLFRTITVSSVQNLSSPGYSYPPLIPILFFSFKSPCFARKGKTRTWTAVIHNSRVCYQWDSSSSSTIFGRPEDWAWRKFEAGSRLLPNHGLGLRYQRWDARIIKKKKKKREKKWRKLREKRHPKSRSTEFCDSVLNISRVNRIWNQLTILITTPIERQRACCTFSDLWRTDGRSSGGTRPFVILRMLKRWKRKTQISELSREQ